MMPGQTVAVEYRQVNPPVIVCEASAPNDIGHVKDASIFQQRLPAADTYYPGNALCARVEQVLRLDTDDRVTTGKGRGLPDDPATGPGVDRQALQPADSEVSD